MTVKNIELSELESEKRSEGGTLTGENYQLIKNVKVQLRVYVGKTDISISDLFNLRDGSVVSINRGVDEPVDILLDDKIIARGHLVAADDSFGVRITEI